MYLEFKKQNQRNRSKLKTDFFLTTLCMDSPLKIKGLLTNTYS